jgi:hypothetical protein
MEVTRMQTLLRQLVAMFVVSAGLALLAFVQPVGLHAQTPNGITSPTAGEVVSGVVEVRGRAVLADFRRIEVYLLPEGNEGPATWVGQRGTQTVGNVLFFDTTRYPDGPYTLRMRIVRQNRNYEEYHVPIEIRNGDTGWVDRNGITAITPISGITVAGPIRVSGIADDPLFSKWELHLLRSRDPSRAVLLNEANTPRLAQALLARVVDTTAFPDGEHALRLRVHRRDRTYQDYVVDIVIDNTRERSAAGNGILEPAAGAEINCTTRVFGIAEHPQFRKWQLDILPAGDANAASFVNWNDIPLPRRGPLATLDTTQFPNGEYVLRLRVVHSNMNYEEHVTPVVVDNRTAECE